jgi:hypothetical protein
MDMGTANAAGMFSRYDARRMSTDSSRRSSDSNYMMGHGGSDYTPNCGPIDEYAVHMRRCGVAHL